MAMRAGRCHGMAGATTGLTGWCYGPRRKETGSKVATGAPRVALGESRQFEAMGLERAHWSSAARIRNIFRDAFARADLQYFNPHSFRNTLVRLGQAVCQTPEQFKAWSQNLGHNKVLTTFLSYGHVESPRQGEIIRGLAALRHAMRSDIEHLADAVVRKMRDSGRAATLGK